MAPLVPPLATPLAAQPNGGGDPVKVTGRVTDRSGNSLPELEVLFVASRQKFDLRTLGKTTRRSTTLRTRTDDAGDFALAWQRDRYYNYFELIVGVNVRTADGTQFRPLERVDLSARVKQGSPVVAAVTVEAAGYVATRSKFLDTVRSSEEQRILRDWGEPDSIDRVRYAGGEQRPESLESSWWYFGSGKCFTFRDGVLVEEFDFDPVLPF